MFLILIKSQFWFWLDHFEMQLFFELMLMVVACLEVFCTCSINMVFFEKQSYFGPI